MRGRQFIDAIQKEKFLVITSWDIRALYFLKSHGFFIYHLIMKKVSRLLNGMREG